jgi:lauroyl/myristoyl acyltransferase
MLKRERRAVAGNLRPVSGKRGLALQWKVYWVFYSFCDLMVSYCYVPQATHPQLLSMLVDPERGAAKIEQCLAAGNGLIVWTAHVGNWEFASRLLEMHGWPVNVARVVEDKPAEIMLRNLMASERLKIVDLKGGVPATLELLQALRRNEIVAMQGDRVYQRHSAEVPFFSQPHFISARPLPALAGVGRAGAARLRDSRGMAALSRNDGRSDPAGWRG